MKHFVILFFFLLTISVYGQDKTNYVSFNKLIEVKGSEYVLATIENVGKMFTTNAQYMMFINTKTGQSKQVDFRKDALIQHIEQVKLDSLQINRIVVTAKTVNLDNNRRIDWNDPMQIIVFSTNGEEKVQLTEDKFFVRTWIIHHQTGGVVVTGYYDTNDNGKYDKTDKDEILLYDLKTLKLIARI
jgi:hypothetical protein